MIPPINRYNVTASTTLFSSTLQGGADKSDFPGVQVINHSDSTNTVLIAIDPAFASSDADETRGWVTLAPGESFTYVAKSTSGLTVQKIKARFVGGGSGSAYVSVIPTVA